MATVSTTQLCLSVSHGGDTLKQIIIILYNTCTKWYSSVGGDEIGRVRVMVIIVCISVYYYHQKATIISIKKVKYEDRNCFIKAKDLYKC